MEQDTICQNLNNSLSCRYIKQLKGFMTRKQKELINNISQTISKELKKPNGGNKKLIDTLQKILDKAS